MTFIIATKANLQLMANTEAEIKVPSYDDLIHTRSASFSIGWHPVRPATVDSFFDRLCQAWAVFRGKADAITWIGQ